MDGVAARDEADPEVLAAAAQSGDDAAFAQLVRRFERELQVHCYRMVGSFSESEDLVQETFVRAWRKLDGFEGRSSVRAWLYRIATNACLDSVRQRRRRVLPYDVAGATAAGGEPPNVGEHLYLEPYPDRLLEGWTNRDDGPDGAVIARETIELAFLAAIQHLPPRQRAVLILRDVLGWSAAESADVLGMTVAGLKSALQRARATMRDHLPAQRHQWSSDAELSDTERSLLERYVRAHEEDDRAALTAVLHEDLRVSYPPHPLWRDSRDSFIDSSAQDAPAGDYRFITTRANMQPAVAIYHRAPGQQHYTPVALEVLRIDGDAIAEIVDFDLPHLAGAFGLPDRL